MEQTKIGWWLSASLLISSMPITSSFIANRIFTKLIACLGPALINSESASFSVTSNFTQSQEISISPICTFLFYRSFVKFSGRNASTHNLSDSPHKWTVIHPLSNCLGALKKLMLSLYGPEPNWLQYFGGHLGTSSIKREDLHKKVRTLLKNTEHHLCINRILYYLSGYPSDMEA